MKQKQMSAAKKLGILFLVIAVVFAAVNLFWLFGIGLRYNGYTDKLEKTEDGGRIYYEKTVGEYLYSVNKPGYMDFKGYLVAGDKDGYIITVKEDGKEEGNGLYIELNIIPNAFGKYRYRLWFCDLVTDLDLFIFIDDEYNYIPSETATEETKAIKSKLVADNLPEIKSLMESAKSFWNIK